MRSSTFWIAVVGIALGILILGGVGIWFQNPKQQSLDSAPTLELSVEPQENIPPRPKASDPTPVPRPTTELRAPAQETVATLPATEIDWERKMEDIINIDQEETATATQLLVLMPQMPESNQVQAVELVIGLLPDESYAVVAPVVRSAATPGEVLDLLMLDLLDRPPEVHLPLLLELARNAEHPRREEAHEYLEAQLRQDFGTDWAAWEQAVQNALQQPEP